MQVTSPCIHHPSKEANQRCRSCHKWLCDACFTRYRGGIYCGRSCHVKGVFVDSVMSALAFAKRPLHSAWVITVIAGASALLLWTVGLKVADLVEINGSLAGRPPDHPIQVDIEASLTAQEQGLLVEARGTPGTRVLLLEGEHPLGIVTLDESGYGELSGIPLRPEAENLRFIPITAAEIDLGPPPPSLVVEEPTPEPTVRPTVPPTPEPTPRKRLRTASSPAAAGPTPSIAPPVLQLIQDAGPRIAITFDGNASSNRTAELLDLLRRQNLKVTLFVTGQFIDKHPSIVRRAVLEGHEIGNHTYSHPHLTTYGENRQHRLIPGMTRDKLQRELRRTEEAFQRATGRSMQPLWRSPFGEENRDLRGWALEVGYLHVRWSSLQGASLDSRDWIADEHSSLYQKSSTIMERLLQFPELEGGIILMHLATERAEAPWQELPAFLDAIKERGLETAKVTTILEESRTWRPWLQRARVRHEQTNAD